MVIIRNAKSDVLFGFLNCSLSIEELNQIHADFAYGSLARFNPTVELFIQDRPELYGLPHQAIRSKLDQEGFRESFLVIDAATPSTRSVWYIEHTGDPFEEDPVITHEGEPFFWKIRLKTEDVPIEHVNYDIANSSISERLGNETDFEKYDPHASQAVSSNGYNYEDSAWLPPAFIIAEPGEWVDSTAEEHVSNFVTFDNGARRHPERVFKLKDDVAEKFGLRKGKWSTETAETAEGCVSLQLAFDKDSPVWQKPYIPLQH
ncbi:hypothetical protein L228DRAFT_248529 [Xylona heveae TC161]|uniref:Uncharacterized protein n=1 Tax=Xylona heveae (strain CBS 132557 / TC161) TaxID=1328760 RepID=A0A165G641_XYLHT|nr:hypothetical protein L228DRAFT_248529 [Xylona heveae TC161]KZF21781.1 hypothetical protein L228DRAFT_248529 [Xylona heveae TC161]